jgi:hypothetical protein
MTGVVEGLPIVWETRRKKKHGSENPQLRLEGEADGPKPRMSPALRSSGPEGAALRAGILG